MIDNVLALIGNLAQYALSFGLVPYTVGAVMVGLVIGFSLGGTFVGTGNIERWQSARNYSYGIRDGYRQGYKDGQQKTPARH